MRRTFLWLTHALSTDSLAVRDSVNGLSTTLPQQLPDYNKLFTSCTTGTADCEWTRYQYQQKVDAVSAQLQTNTAPSATSLINQITSGTVSLQKDINQLSTIINAPTVLNGLASTVKDMKLAMVAAQGLINSLVKTTSQKAKAAQRDAAQSISQAASDFQGQMNSYLVSLQGIVRSLDTQIAVASSQQLANFGATAAAAAKAANQTLNTASQGVQDATANIAATGNDISTSLATTASSISDASDTVADIASSTERGAASAEVGLQGTLISGASAVVKALNQTAASTVAATQYQTQQYAKSISKAIGQQDSLMTSALSSLSSAGSSAVANLKQNISATFSEANNKLTTASASATQSAADITTGFTAVAQDASNAVTDSSKMVSMQSSQYSQLSGSTQAQLSSLSQLLATAFTDTQTNFASLLDKHSSDASAQIQEQNANLGNVNDNIAQTLQNNLMSALQAAAAAQQQHGQNAADIDQQLQDANDLISTSTTELNGQVQLTTGKNTARLQNAASTTQSGMSSLAALLAQINSKSADSLSSASEAVDGNIADTSSRLNGQLADVQNAAAHGFSDLSDLIARSSNGLNVDASTISMALQSLLEGVGSSSSGIAAQKAALAALGRKGSATIAELNANMANMAGASASAIQGSQANAKTLLNKALLGVSAYQSNVTYDVNNQVQAMLANLADSNGATQDALSQGSAAAASIVSGATAQLSSALNLKSAFEQQIAQLGQQTSASSMNILNQAGGQHAAFMAQIQGAYSDHQSQVQKYLKQYLAQSLNNSMNATQVSLGTSGAQLKSVLDTLSLLQARAQASLSSVTDGINSMPIDKQNLQAQAAQVQQAFQQAQQITDAQLDETYNTMQDTMTSKNDSIQQTFTELQHKADNVTALVQAAGKTLMKNVAAQQLQIDGFINQLRQVMNLSAMQDEANRQAEMSAQLSKLSSSSANINSSAADVESKIEASNADRISRNVQLADGLDGIVGSANATISGSADAADATREALVAAGNVADVAFTGIQDKMNSESSTFSAALEKQQHKQSDQIAAAELEASREASAIAADASSAAQLWEGSVQSGLNQVSQNTQSLSVLFDNLAAINSSVLEDLNSMLDTINAAYGSSIDQANNSANYSLTSFARVQDVVSIFGQIIEQFVDESTTNMNSAKSDASLIGTLVSDRLDELDNRVNDQIRWLEGGVNSTAMSQSTGLISVLGMQEAEKAAVAEVDKSLKEMDGDISTSVNAIEASLAEAQMDSNAWASNVMKKVSDWQTSARRRFANQLITSRSSFLEKKRA